jgi:hypothetical protein
MKMLNQMGMAKNIDLYGLASLNSYGLLMKSFFFVNHEDQKQTNLSVKITWTWSKYTKWPHQSIKLESLKKSS